MAFDHAKVINATKVYADDGVTLIALDYTGEIFDTDPAVPPFQGTYRIEGLELTTLPSPDPKTGDVTDRVTAIKAILARVAQQQYDNRQYLLAAQRREASRAIARPQAEIDAMPIITPDDVVQADAVLQSFAAARVAPSPAE